jgi:phage-related protein
MKDRRVRFKVLPLPVVQKWAKKELSRLQLRAGIKLARQLRFYPNVPDLSLEPCGDGMELRIEHPEIGRRGWLRAIFWVDQESKTIYLVDLFWKKTNAISTADKLRANHRIRGLKVALVAGKKPWT